MLYKLLMPDILDAESISQIDVEEQSEVFIENKLLVNLCDSLSQMLIIINEERQIIYANKPYLNFCGFPDCKSVIGKRPGEVLNCIYAFLTESGCGTTRFCRSCGIAKVIAESGQGEQSTRESQISTQNNDPIDLRVTTTPYEYKGQLLTIIAILDISDQKRRETLERVFFHDILNSAGGISGLSSLMKEIEDPVEVIDIANTINHAAQNLVEEIQMQHQLNAAERGELKLNIQEVSSLSILKDLKNIYSRHELVADKSILINKNSEDVKLNTDPVILRRVLANMLKNALEVYNPKAQITLSCIPKNQSVQFSIHNTSFIEHKVQLQLFKRSFSTKGMGRGLGTYSMKLLGEKYLKGKVRFKSSIEKGTTFFIEI